MEEILTQFLNSGPVGIIAAAVVYLVIALQRNSTKKTRDENQDKLETRVSLLENEMKQIKQLDLDARLAAIETSLKYIEKLLEDSRK
jgi:Tfp pilus assembly protein PilN